MQITQWTYKNPSHFRHTWNPELTTQFAERENIENMMSEITSILVEFPDKANIDNINQAQYKINELVCKVGELLKTTAGKLV